MYGFVYITTNTINGRKYIGQRVITNTDRDKAYLGSGTYIKKAVKKYGKSAFIREILCFSMSQNDLDEAEVKFLKEHNASLSPQYYNVIDELMPLGNRGNKDFKHSEQTKRELSKRRLENQRLKGNNYVSQEAICRMREFNKKYWTIERRKEHSQMVKASIAKLNKNPYPNIEQMLQTMSLSEIGVFYGVTGSAISQYIKRNMIIAERNDNYFENINKKRRESAKLAHTARKLQAENTWKNHDLKKMYQTMKQIEMAQIIGVSQTRISQKLKELGIKKIDNELS